jgi:hypothetical protein
MCGTNACERRQRQRRVTDGNVFFAQIMFFAIKSTG